MWLLVVGGFFVDQVILYAVSVLGIVSPFQFLLAMVKWVREQTEDMNAEALKQLVGTRIRESRTKKEFTQEDLSEKADTAVAQISKLERGLCCSKIQLGGWQTHYR